MPSCLIRPNGLGRKLKRLGDTAGTAMDARVPSGTRFVSSAGASVNAMNHIARETCIR